MRVYWRHCDDLEVVGNKFKLGFLRYVDVPLEDVTKLIEISQMVDYVCESEGGEIPYQYSYSELVLGDPDEHYPDHVNIWVDNCSD